MKVAVALAFSPIEQLVPLARACDELGYHAVALSDHVTNPEVLRSPYPYTADGERRWAPFTPWPDPWVTIGALAAHTTRLRFFTNVYVLPMRTPFAVAKAVGTASVLSGGRVALGVGMGWMEQEFELLEQPFRNRGKRADEMLDVLRVLWQGGWVEHHGDFYDFDRLEMTPTPAAPVPVYVGGISDPALRRAARNDGWISDLETTETLTRYCATLREHRAALGREGEPFEVIASCSDAFDVDGYKRLEAIGVTQLLTQPWVFHHGFTDDLDLRLDGLARFAEETLRRL